MDDQFFFVTIVIALGAILLGVRGIVYTEFNPVDECCICFEDISRRDKATLKCGHTFHFSCASKVRSYRCPLCRCVFG
jgi:hypothetical protein